LIASLTLPGRARAASAEPTSQPRPVGVQGDGPRKARLTPTAVSRPSVFDTMRSPAAFLTGVMVIGVGVMVGLASMVASMFVNNQGASGSGLLTGLGVSALFVIPGAALSAFGASQAWPASPTTTTSTPGQLRW